MLVLRTISIIGLIALPGLGNTESLDQYLVGARAQAHEAMHYDTASSPLHWNTSWIESAQFRVQHEQDKRGDESETYRLRIAPVFGRERSEELNAQRAGTQKIVLRTERAVSGELRQRYLKIIGVQEHLAQNKALIDKKVLLRAEINNARGLSQTSKFNPQKLQHLVLDLNHSSKQLALSHRRLSRALDELKIELPHHDDGLSPWLISPQAMMAERDDLSERLEDYTLLPTVQAVNLDKTIADSRLRGAQAKTGFGVNFLELKYEDKDNSSTGISVGFRLPIGNDNALLSKKLDKLNADSKYFYAASTTTTAVHKTLDSIEWDFMTWESAQAALSELQTLMAQPERAQSPELITGLRQQQLSLTREATAAHMGMLKNFIKLLDLSGSLSQVPLVNWLHTGTPVLAAN